MNKHSSQIPVYILFGWFLATMGMWLFAFYKVPTDSAEWLSRAQAVCFGTDEHGLPDTYGWTMLILAPLSFALAIIVAFKQDLISGTARLISTNSGFVAIVALGILIIIQGFWAGDKIQAGLELKNHDYSSPKSGSLPDNYFRSNRPAPEFGLLNQYGQLITNDSLKNKVTVITFAFAHCQTICPAIVQNIKQASGMLSNEDVEFIIVTLDPWRDRPSTLPALAKRWELASNQHILSGEVEIVNNVISAFDVATTRNEQDGDIAHPAVVHVLSKQGEIAYTFNNPPAQWLQEAALLLLKEW